MSHSAKLLSCTAARANGVPGNRDFNKPISLMYNFKALSHNYNARIIRWYVCPIWCETESTFSKNCCFQIMPSFKLHWSKKVAYIFLLFQEEEVYVFSPQIPYLYSNNTNKSPEVSWNRNVTLTEDTWIFRIQASMTKFPWRLFVLPVCSQRLPLPSWNSFLF